MNKRDVVVALTMTVFILLGYSIFFFLNDEALEVLTSEDGFFEYLGVAGLILGSILLVIQFWKDAPGNDLLIVLTRRNLFYLVFALVFFVGAGEEISWGQRLLGFQSPEFFKQHNIQTEFNVHNLDKFDGNIQGALIRGNFIFNFFWFLFFVLVPFANLLAPTASAWFRRINVPVGPPWIGVLLLLTYGIAKFLEHNFGIRNLNRIQEVKECDFELLLCLVALWLFLEARGKARNDKSPSESVSRSEGRYTHGEAMITSNR